jgi:hypothetical protein
MAKLDKIPPKQLGSLQSLATMKEEDFQSLALAIKDTPAALDPTLFFKHVAERVKTIPSQTVEGITEVACAFYHFKQIGSGTISQIMTEIENSAKAEGAGAYQLLLSNLNPLSARLVSLIGLELSLGVTAKALDVMMEHDHVFGHARILSDIRPVFTGGAESIAAAFIIHNLSIHYFHDGDHKEFFVVLDNDDLNTLKEAIARAEQKAEVLKAVFKKASIPYLDVE